MYRQLGQLRPGNTSAASLFSPTVSGQYKVFSILIANSDAGAATASVYHDVDGTTYDQTTAIVYNKSIATGDYLHLQFPDGICDYQLAGNIGVKSSVASALTFTAYGEVEGQSL